MKLIALLDYLNCFGNETRTILANNDNQRNLTGTHLPCMPRAIDAANTNVTNPIAKTKK